MKDCHGRKLWTKHVSPSIERPPSSPDQTQQFSLRSGSRLRRDLVESQFQNAGDVTSVRQRDTSVFQWDQNDHIKTAAEAASKKTTAFVRKWCKISQLQFYFFFEIFKSEIFLSWVIDQTSLLFFFFSHATVNTSTSPLTHFPSNFDGVLCMWTTSIPHLCDDVFFLKWSETVLTQCDFYAVLHMSSWWEIQRHDHDPLQGIQMMSPRLTTIQSSTADMQQNHTISDNHNNHKQPPTHTHSPHLTTPHYTTPQPLHLQRRYKPILFQVTHVLRRYTWTVRASFSSRNKTDHITERLIAVIVIEKRNRDEMWKRRERLKRDRWGERWRKEKKQNANPPLSGTGQCDRRIPTRSRRSSESERQLWSSWELQFESSTDRFTKHPQSPPTVEKHTPCRFWPSKMSRTILKIDESPFDLRKSQ